MLLRLCFILNQLSRVSFVKMQMYAAYYVAVAHLSRKIHCHGNAKL